MKKSELRDLLPYDVSGLSGHCDCGPAPENAGHQPPPGLRLINDGHLAGMKIGNSFKIPKVSVIRYVMEQEAQDHAG